MARNFGIRAGDMVRLMTRRGDAVVKARLARTIRMDTLFVPFHWGGKGCANLLTNAALDPVSRIPEFKACAVRIEKSRCAAKALNSSPRITPCDPREKPEMMDATPRFLNGVFDFEGRGLGRPAELDPALSYTVPSDKRTQLIYLRAGNSLDELVYLVLTKNGAPMRYFPIGAKAVTHVPLAVVEDLFPETKLEIFFAAPEGMAGTVVLDIGLMEI